VRNGGVGVLIDGDRRRGMGTKDNGFPVTNTGLSDDRIHLAGDIDHLAPASRTDPKIFLNYFHDYTFSSFPRRRLLPKRLLRRLAPRNDKRDVYMSLRGL